MTANPETVIETHALTRTFGTTTAVDKLDLAVKRGEIFGLLGHNGAGKTTTVRLLNGVLGADSGTAKVMGYSPFEQGQDVRRRTGVLTETPALYEALNARENLTIFGKLYYVPNAELPARVDRMLAQFDLADRATEKVGGFSKGMKQRLALARAFLHDPDVLFLDEPAAGLDPVASKQVNELILALSREHGRTVLLATHNLHDAERLCDRVAVMEHGRLVALGAPAELRHGLDHTTRLELEVPRDDLTLACQTVEALGYTVDTRPEDSQLLVSGVAFQAVPEMVNHLTSAGVRLYRVAPEAPSLEDVYFALHRRDAERTPEVTP